MIQTEKCPDLRGRSAANGEAFKAGVQKGFPWFWRFASMGFFI